jgi:hypothetical protein
MRGWMKPSCDHYQQEILLALPERQLRTGLVKTTFSATPQEGMTSSSG